MRADDIFLNDDVDVESSVNYNPLTADNSAKNSFSGSIPRESSSQHPLSFELACPDGYNSDIFRVLPLEMQIEIIEERNELSQQQRQQEAAPQQASTRTREPESVLNSDNNYNRSLSPISLFMACCGCLLSYPKSFCIAFLTGLRKQPHIKLFLYTLLWLGPLIANFYIFFIQNIQSRVVNVDDDNPNTNAIATVIIEMVALPTIFLSFYVCYLTVTFRSATYKLISNKSSWVELNDYIRRVKAARPNLYENAYCYHLSLRTNSVNNNNGSITYYSYVVQEKLHSENQYFPFQTFADISNLPTIDQNYGLAQVYSTKRYQLGNSLTRERFGQFKTAFHAEHARCDSKRHFSTLMSIPGFEEHVLAFQDRSHVPFCVEYRFMFILIAVLGGSWIYAVWLSGYAKRYDLEFTKRFTC